MLGGERLAKIIAAAKQNFLTGNAEITVEINPADSNAQLMKSLALSGVNRISMGVQSAVPNELEVLTRRHNNCHVQNSVVLAHKYGITNVSVDLMMGIPGQTLDSLSRSIDFLLSLNPAHISCYILKVEPNTPMEMSVKNGLALPDETLTSQLYIETDRLLTSSGFEHYEISNFAKQDMRSKHNMKYWKLEEYLGIGPSAHSFLNGKRFFYPADIKKFLSKPETIPDGIGGDKEEYIMLALRLSDGIIFSEYEKKFNEKLPEKFFKKCRTYEDAGFMVTDNIRAALTPKGFLVSNFIICELAEL